MLKMRLKNGMVDYTGRAFIPPDIHTICDGAFACCGDLKLVIIPKSVKVIGAKAFWGCPHLTDVMFIGRVEHIGDGAFGNCRSLKKLTLPGSVRYVGPHVADGTPLSAPIYNSRATALLKYPACFEAVRFEIPKTVRQIAKNCFWGCSALKEIILPEGLEVIPSGAFFGCGIRSVTIPASVELIEPQAFMACRSLESVTFLSDATEIADGAFSGCKNPKLIFPSKMLRFDRYVRAMGLSFLRPADIPAAKYPTAHLRERRFKRLSEKAAAGSAEAMLELAKFFDEKAAASRNPAYPLMSNFWTYMAADAGSDEAAGFVEEWIAENPGKCWAAPINERLEGVVGGRILKSLGFSFPVQEGADCAIERLPDGRRRVILSSGEQSETAAGELYDLWLCDKMLNPAGPPLTGLSRAEINAIVMHPDGEIFTGGGYKNSGI